ncbi:MAG: PTS sugar transporter subunit IIA [Terrimicrobiaceae bacterium]|nr:PTS sugar transporter subunit IIA [Terrimicrobiaceae bacterium]
MTIEEILHPADVISSLRAGDKPAAIDEVLTQVRGDARVANWERLRAVIIGRDAPAIEQNGRGICIAHGRTDAVTGLVVAAGRSEAGIVFPEIKPRVHLVFVVGIPATMDSEYLRLVGAIARVCRNPNQLEQLLAANDGGSFVECLAAATERL